MGGLYEVKLSVAHTVTAEILASYCSRDSPAHECETSRFYILQIKQMK